METGLCWEQGTHTGARKGEDAPLVSWLDRSHCTLGHEDEGKSFKSAVKLFWYLVQSEGLGLCFLSHFLE